jgi:hypothetical protein
LYAKWKYPEGTAILDVNEVEQYLETQIGGKNTDDPVLLNVQINLENMTNANSGWGKLIAAIGKADKYVKIDLSSCTMNGTEFNQLACGCYNLELVIINAQTPPLMPASPDGYAVVWGGYGI